MHSPEFSHILQSITENGFAIEDNFLPAETIAALAKHAVSLQQTGQLKNAKTGQRPNLQSDQKIRGDQILWLQEDDPTSSVQAYLQKMYALREALNQNFYLGLHALEAHFAIYPVGARYAKHLDQFDQGANSLRQVSCVLYLNQDWQEAYGGQLRLYLAKEPSIDMLPIGGRLVIFMSGEFLHEVLPATQPRISLTGWFRRRDSRLV